ncbi:MAG: phosphatase PAP2 family protein [Fibrobacteria bacterium]|nr:phosphatase PAP2 family protein [Fibrobacteria bacterium]
MQYLDTVISNWFINHQSRYLSILFRMISTLGAGHSMVIIYVSTWIFVPNFRRVVYTIVLGEIIGLCVILVFRRLVKRKRPCTNPQFLIPFPWHKNSFPSHHALRSAMLLVVVSQSFPNIFIFLLVIAGMVCFSRIYLTMHFLTDILAGIIFGTIVGYLAICMY